MAVENYFAHNYSKRMRWSFCGLSTVSIVIVDKSAVLGVNNFLLLKGN